MRPSRFVSSASKAAPCLPILLLSAASALLAASGTSAATAAAINVFRYFIAHSLLREGLEAGTLEGAFGVLPPVKEEQSPCQRENPRSARPPESRGLRATTIGQPRVGDRRRASRP